MSDEIAFTKVFAGEFMDIVDTCDRVGRSPNVDHACRILLDVVHCAQMAGVKAVVPGVLRGNHPVTGVPCTVNDSFPYKVVGEDGDDHRATVWLDCIFSAVRHNTGTGQTRDELIAGIQAEIVRTRPLRPIVLTAMGDTLREFPRESYWTMLGLRDENAMSTCPGVHDPCLGFVWLKPETPTHNALSCSRCNWRVGIPVSVKTYGELRKHLSQFNS